MLSANSLKRGPDLGRQIPLVLLGLLCGGLTAGCDPGTQCQFFGNCPNTVSDGSMFGINGWDVAATIDVQPNSGPSGTSVAITINFQRGGAHAANIAVIQRNGSECTVSASNTDYLYRDALSRWKSVSSLILTGRPGRAEFVALSASGERIALGEININGGCGSATGKERTSDDADAGSNAEGDTTEISKPIFGIKPDEPAKID